MAIPNISEWFMYLGKNKKKKSIRLCGRITGTFNV